VPIVNPYVTRTAINSNNSLNTAEQIDEFFSLDSPDSRNPNVEFSTRIPYVSLRRANSALPDSFDYFSFEVTTAGTRAIIDIDKTSPDFDTVLTLIDNQGNELTSNNNAPTALGADGSFESPLIGTGGSSLLPEKDSYLRYVFSEPGRYFIRVGRSEGGNIVPIASGGTYELQVSLDTPRVASSVVNSGRSVAASGLFARTEGAGAAGDVTINTPKLFVQEGAQVSASTSSRGQGGSLTVTAPQAVTLSGNSRLSVETSGAGRAGNVTITSETLNVERGARVSATATANATTSEQGGSIKVNANQVNLSGRGGLFSETEGAAPAGSLRLQPFNGQTLTVNLQDGAKVSASTTSRGQGGSLIVEAPEVVTLSGNGQLSAETSGTGRAGDVTINTQQLTVQDRAQVSASTSSRGEGGSVQVNASESVLLNNQGSLLTESSSTGASGDLTINTRQLTLQEGSQVSASTRTGTAGNVTVNATESVELSGASDLSVEATEGGTAGDLRIETGQMSVLDGAKVTVSSPSGQAGNLTVTADSLFLNRGTISAETGKSGAEGGANITLQGLDFLRMDNESLISASALEEANGGNITIDSTFIVATPPQGSKGSDITANAFRGNGGRVSITTQGLFGIEFRPNLTPLNDITVSSDFGLAGVFEQNTPGVDPSRGLAELPTDVVDASGLIDRRCTPGGTAQNGSFTITGRGGLPPSPNETLQGEAVITNWVSLDSDVENNTPPATTTPRSFAPRQLVEAQGWIMNEKGQVVLTASAPKVTPQGEWLPEAKCNPPQTEDSPQS
jgi:large exoprotein involved in heme utilization and adhesion